MDNDKLDRFLDALTNCCRSYGIAIAGGAILFVIGAGDPAIRYECTTESELIITEE